MTGGKLNQEVLNHHGQLTGFNQPVQRTHKAPSEPQSDLIFILWSLAIIHSLHQHRMPTAFTMELYIVGTDFMN